MKASVKSLILTDPTGKNWKVAVYHDGYIKQLYTERADEAYDEIVQEQVIIKSFNARFKLKINSEGRLVTYKIDDLE